MKKVFRNRYVAGLCLAISMFLVSLPASAQLMLAHEGHHDDSGCKVDDGDFPVAISIYEVPEGNIPPMHSYCSHVPNAGKINMTIELSDAKTREVPIAVRVLMEGHEGSEHGAHEVLYMPAEKYSSGIIVVATNLEQVGQYNVQLETDDGAGNVKTAVKIPLHIGEGSGHSHGSNFGTMELILLAGVGIAGAFIFLRKKDPAKA
ncbi:MULTISPECIES: hypothetical protein [Nitrosomonas]|uniref:Uncharacterized protein n=2 Tax=Nitrosomonas eutropha TaxID=916 RepID=A0ABX5M909_9PROT|nr:MULTISPECIES: hypothetical protein [Nitrosomonas]ABI58544.1 putative (U92432) ORF4 (Nitrosospira sp, NpAV) [Nitrosomonas eutropha C91]MXS80964.1 hypothetical protein [Nitrosomonas sp. GH22]PXV82339.1 hypothetical protein C8R14_10850 [Nitrosomonas eutropha]SCX13380.1 hypothetical protein SAMN05216379_10857 [Nitrosomonas eutropha]SDW14832.1 hypothetical protein SAMN05216317_102188 [Nitrosomonas eutropha]